MVKRHWLSVLFAGVVFLIVGIGMVAKSETERAELLAKFPDRGVPRMNITLNEVTLDEINAGSKETKYEGNELTVYEGDEMTLEAGGVRVKGRGNGTWAQEKKPYQIRFDKKVDLFGMGKARKWVLLANALDVSNIRTSLTFSLEEILEMEQQFRGQFVELYFNDEYEGLYYLTHAVEISKDVVDLKDQMGVLVELDNLYGAQDKNYKTRNGNLLVLKDSVDKEHEEEAMRSFLNDFNRLEKAVEGRDYAVISRIIDTESFAKYYLLSEFSVNPDAYWTSFYFYKDGLDDKIHGGPAWDFDLAFANRRWGNWMGESFYSPTQTMVRRGEILPKEVYDEMGVEGGYESSILLSRLIFDLMELEEFQEEVRLLFQDKMSWKIDALIEKMYDEARKVEEVSRIDNEKWQKGDYWAEIDAMARWMKERDAYFEEKYGAQEVFNEVDEVIVEEEIQY